MKEQLINQYGFSTIFGEKSFELYMGDIMASDLPYEVLVISAYEGDYYPFYGTLIASVEKSCGISVQAIADAPMIDMRDSMGIWVSKSLKQYPLCKFKYIICIEMLDADNIRQSIRMLSQKIHNLFSVLEVLSNLDHEINHVLMPLIGTGSQGIPPEYVFEPLFNYGQGMLMKCKEISKIQIMVRRPAYVTEASVAMDQVLGRSEVDSFNLKNDEECQVMLENILDHLMEIVHIKEELKTDHATIVLMNLMSSEVCAYSNMATNCRKWMELMLYKLLVRQRNQNKGKVGLSELINLLSKSDLFPARYISYMHLVRCMGNEEVHAAYGKKKPIEEKKEEEGLKAIDVNADLFDLRALLYAFYHVLEAIKLFWVKNGTDAVI